MEAASTSLWDAAAILSTFVSARPQFGIIFRRWCTILIPLWPGMSRPSTPAVKAQMARTSPIRIRIRGWLERNLVAQAVAPPSWPGLSGPSVAARAGGDGPDEPGHDE
jgi:hypothetical protein